LVELNARLAPFDRISRCHTCPKMTRERYKLIHKCKGPEYDPNAVDGEDDIESLLAEFEEEDPENGVAVLGVVARVMQGQEENERDGNPVGGASSSTPFHPTTSQVREFVENIGNREGATRAQNEETSGAVENVDVGAGGSEPARPAGPRSQRGVLSVKALADLIAQFQQGLHYVHPNWLDPMREISVKCWDLARGTGSNENRAVLNYAGFLILPGLISVMRKPKGGGNSTEKTIDFLRDVAKDANPGVAIVKKALTVQADLEAERIRQQGNHNYQAPTADSLARQVEKFIDEDKLSAAAGVIAKLHAQLEGEAVQQPPLSMAEIREKIASLHPDSDAGDLLPNVEEDPECTLQVEEGDVWSWIRKLHLKSAPGVSGWTNRLIRAMMTMAKGTRSAANEKLLRARTAFANLINAVLNGSLSNKVAELMALTRSVLFPKPGGGWRPLGIGEGWYRLMWRVVMGKVGLGLGRNLMPHQLAVGVKGGCEIGARVAQIAYDSGGAGLEDGEEQMCLIQLDLENAFNLQARRQIYDALVRRCPNLVRMFRKMYGFKSRLYGSNGECVGMSSTGVRQGCPGAMALFSCGQQDILLELHAAVLAVKEQVGSALPAGVSGFADDTTVFIGERGVNEVISKGREIFGRNRVRWRVDKCQILVHPGRGERVYREEVDEDSGSRQTIPPEFEVVDTGIKVLGTPVGTEDFRRAWLETAFADMVRPLPALTRVNPQSAFILLQLCFNARPSFLVRVCEPHMYMPFAHDFDKAIDKALADIACTELTPEISTLRSLPQRLGGLSLARHCGPQSEKGCLASRALTKTYITEHRPELQPGMELWRHVEVGEANEARYHADLVLEDPESFDDINRALPEEVLSILADHEYTWTVLHHSLQEAGRKRHAAWLLSGSSYGTAKWLNWRGGLHGRYRFGRGEFLEALRLRLLVDPFPNPGTRICSHCARVRFVDNPTHALDCAKLTNARVWRHNAVRDHLQIALQKVFPEARFRVEHTIAGDTPGKTVRTDIHMSLGPRTVVFDVAVVDPAAPSYLAQSSFKEPNVAAKQREDAKRAHWAAIGGVTGVEFIPFVVEATGRMGPSALTYFKRKIESEDNPHIAKTFLTNMNYAIAKWNAKMILKSRDLAPQGFGPSQGADRNAGGGLRT